MTWVLPSSVSVESDNDPLRVTWDETMMVVVLFGDEGGNMRLPVIFALLGLCVAWTVSAPAVEVAPLELVADVPLSGAAVRFDYQSLDVANNRLYIAHMNADQLVVFDLNRTMERAGDRLPFKRPGLVGINVGRSGGPPRSPEEGIEVLGWHGVGRIYARQVCRFE